MRDSEKSNSQLLDELVLLREQIESLNESEIRYRNLSETILEAIAIHDEGIILESNGAFANIFEYSPSELIGKNILDLIAEDSKELVVKRMKSGYNKAYEANVQTKNGKILQGILTGVDVPYKGKTVRMVTIRDVSAETLAKADLKKAMNKLMDIEAAVNRSPAILFLWRAEEGWAVEIVSDNVSQLGYSPDEFISGKLGLPDITHPEDCERVQNEILDYLAKGVNEWEQSYRFIVKNGQIRWMRDWNRVLRDEKGKVTHVQSVILDVTEQKEAELALAEEKEWLRTTLRSIGDAVIATDYNGKVTLMNTLAEELTGWCLDNALGRPLAEIFRIVNEKTGKPCDNPVEKVLQSGAVIGLANHTALITTGGELIPIEDSGAPIRNRDGEIIGVVLVFRDVREKKLAEKALKASEERYRTLFQTANDGIFLIKDYHIIDCNEKAEEQYRLSREEIVGKWPHQLSPEFQPNDLDSYEKSIVWMDNAINKGPQYFEWTHTRGDGTTFVAEISLNKTVIDDENYILALIRDITERKEMERELRQSEERNRMLIGRAPLGIFLSDIAGNLQIVNQALVDILGSPSQEATMQINILEFPPLVEAGISPKIRQAIEKNELLRSEVSYTSKWGKSAICTLYLDPVHGPNGEVIAVQGIIEDITDRKAAEERLREERKQLLSIFDGIGEAVYVCDPETYEVLFVNRCLREMLSDNPIGKKCYKEFQGFDKPCSFCTNDIIMKNPDEVYQWEFFNTNLDRHYLLFDRIIKWPDDRHVRFEMAIDITDRKNAEMELAAEKERLAVTLRSIGDGVITTDTEGRVVMLNKVAEELTGWKQSEAVGKHIEEIFDIVNEMTGEKRENPVDKALNTGEIVELANHTKLISRDGTERIIADSGAPIRDRESKIIGVVLVFRDVTRAKELEEELTRAQKLESVGLLAGGIAHDFNNILTAIIGNISVARERTSVDSDQFDILLDAEKASLQARNLTQQLLTFSRGGAPVRNVCSIKKILDESCGFALRGSNSVCSLDIDEKLFNIEVDEGQISQVLHNLIINADQAMDMGGEIHISAKNIKIDDNLYLPLPEGDYIIISVKDTGKGIPKRDIDKIFDPYFTTKKDGTGLGLAVCYSIVKNHDGYITAVSEPGKGTEFQVYLPASAKLATSEELQEAKSGRFHGRVILMDDESIVRKAAKAMLTHLGLDVILVDDGSKLIEVFRAEKEAGRPFDLVVMDLTVRGGMGGVLAIGELKRIDKDATVIVSSGYSTDPIMARYRDYGFSGVLTKPYKMSEIISVLESLLGEE
jgi:PAS domain S-box-containing protein